MFFLCKGINTSIEAVLVLLIVFTEYSASLLVPPGMVDGCDVGVPDWGNDGNEDRFEISDGGRREGDAHGPEGPVDKQAYCSDYDEKPRGLGGTGVVAGPAPVLPEARGGGYQVSGDGGDDPGDFRTQGCAAHYCCSQQQGGVERSVGPAVETRSKDRALVKKDGKLTIDPIGHGEEEKKPEEDLLLILPGDRDEDE